MSCLQLLVVFGMCSWYCSGGMWVIGIVDQLNRFAPVMVGIGVVVV